jgi:hypothetical protein
LSKPGIYVGSIRATATDTGNGPENTEFELWSTIIVPYTFTSGNRYTHAFKGQSIGPSDVNRYFILLPPGATGLSLSLETGKETHGEMVMALYDPEGHSVDEKWISADQDKKSLIALNEPVLFSGIWEVDVMGYFRLDESSAYDLTIRFFGLESSIDGISTYSQKLGTNPFGTFSVTNLFNFLFLGSATGELEGFQKSDTITIQGDKVSIPFYLNDDFKRVDFELEMSAETYNRFTDIAFNIMDSSGKVIVKDSFRSRSLKIPFKNPSSGGYYTLEIVGGKTHKGGAPWKVRLTERYILYNGITVDVKQNDSWTLRLFPGLKTEVTYTFSRIPPMAPPDTTLTGYIEFKDEPDGNTWLKLPIHIKSTFVLDSEK